MGLDLEEQQLLVELKYSKRTWIDALNSEGTSASMASFPSSLVVRSYRATRNTG